VSVRNLASNCNLDHRTNRVQHDCCDSEVPVSQYWLNDGVHHRTVLATSDEAAMEHAERLFDHVRRVRVTNGTTGQLVGFVEARR
jgi:hypothetical protein